MLEEMLVKIFVTVPGMEPISRENLWAKPLGNHHYELRNTPFLANGFSWGDIVLCRDSEDDLPEIVEVVERRGNKTVRVFFDENTPTRRRKAVLEILKTLKVGFEGAFERFYTLDVTPEANFERVISYLAEHQSAGTLKYEIAAQ